MDRELNGMRILCILLYVIWTPTVAQNQLHFSKVVNSIHAYGIEGDLNNCIVGKLNEQLPSVTTIMARATHVVAVVTRTNDLKLFLHPKNAFLRNVNIEFMAQDPGLTDLVIYGTGWIPVWAYLK